MKQRKQNKLQLTFYILLLLVVALTPLLTTTAWAAGYDYYASIVIDNTKVEADHVNFPVLVSGTYDGTAGEPDIRTTGNGGNVQNTDATGGVSGALTVPADLVFSPNTDGSTPYDFEFEAYDATTGEIIAWVEIPTMDADADLTFYMVYGDASVTTTQEDISGVWDVNYITVYHQQEESGLRYDSSSNDNNLTDNNTVLYGTGQIGNASDFELTNAEYLSITDGAQTGLDLTGDFTASLWMKLEQLPSTPAIQFTIASKFDFGDAERSWIVDISAADHLQMLASDDGTFDAGHFINIQSTDLDGGDIGVLRHVVYRFDISGDTGSIYLDNVDVTDTIDGTMGATIHNGTAPFAFSSMFDSGTPAYYYDGLIDEMRISNIIRTDNWNTTEYNNQYSVATFYTMGSEIAPATPTPTATDTLTPTPSDTPTPTITPTPSDTPTPTATPPWYTCDPSVVIDQDLQDEISDALIADVPNVDANCWAISDIYTVGDYSMISLVGLEADEPVDYNDWTFQDALWTGTAIIRDNGDTTYTTGLDEDATYLTLLGESSFSDPNDGADQGGGGGNWIWFPWLAGTQGFYGSRGVHRASVALPGWVAVDFVGGVNYGDTTFPNMIYGSYTEPIKSVCRDGTAVGLTTENFYYLHLEESTSFQPGQLIRQGQPIGSLVMGSFNDKCGWASQNATSYHLHFGFKPSTGYASIENWILTTSDEIWRNGAQSADIGGSLLAEWPDHDGPIPTAGPSVTPGGPTVTPGAAPPPPRVYGGDSLWDPFIYGLYDMARVTAERFPEHTASGIGSQITSGAEIAIRVAFVMLTSNFDLTISIIIFGLISAAEIVRLIYAIYLGVKKLIPLLG